MKMDRIISMYHIAWLMKVKGRLQKSNALLTSCLLCPPLPLPQHRHALVLLRMFGKVLKITINKEVNLLQKSDSAFPTAVFILLVSTEIQKGFLS